MSLQLRFLQTMLEISSERSSTIILPVPIDLFTPFLEATRRARRDDDLTPDLGETRSPAERSSIAPARARRPGVDHAARSPSRPRPSSTSARSARDARTARRRRPTRSRPADRAPGHSRAGRSASSRTSTRRSSARRSSSTRRATRARSPSWRTTELDAGRDGLARAPPGRVAPKGSRTSTSSLNEGRAAGSSLPHSHSQLVWLREPPPAVLEELPRLEQGRCGVCDVLRRREPRDRAARRRRRARGAGRPRPLRARCSHRAGTRAEPSEEDLARRGPRSFAMRSAGCATPRARSRSTPGCTRAGTGTSSSCRV